MEAHDALIADGRRLLIVLDKHGRPLATAGLVLDSKRLDTLSQGDILLEHDAVEGHVIFALDDNVSSCHAILGRPVGLPIAVTNQ